MLIPAKNMLDEKKTMIFIFIHQITSKKMQDLIFFLQKNDFSLKKITKKSRQQDLTSIFVNSNFILESQQKIRSQQLKEVITFLNQYAQIHGVCIQKQILNLERTATFEKQSLSGLWIQINNYTL